MINRAKVKDTAAMPEGAIRSDFHGCPVYAYGRINSGFTHNPDCIDLYADTVFRGHEFQG